MNYIQHHQRLGLSVKVRAKNGVTFLVLDLPLLINILCVKFVRNSESVLIIVANDYHMWLTCFSLWKCQIIWTVDSNSRTIILIAIMYYIGIIACTLLYIQMDEHGFVVLWR